MEKKNHYNWKAHDELIRQQIQKQTPDEQIAEMLNVPLYDLQQYIHRERIFRISREPRNLAFEIIKIKFIHPEYFRPTRKFFRAVGMTQRQWWAAFRGERKLTEDQYKQVALHLGITLEEAFNARQLEITFEK